MAGPHVELASAYITLIPTLKGANEELRRELNPAMAAGIGAGIGSVLAQGIGRGVSAIGSILPQAIAAGGDLEQSVGAINTVFKGGAGQMLAWSDSAATAVGLTKNEYNTLGTLIGSQLKNGGTAMGELAGKTNGLISTGADLASMFGGTTQEAVEALSSALKGERDPIERYGVSLSQAKIDAEAASLGFEKVGGTLSAEASQAATLSLIMKQTADAHGNFGRESDTLAHKQQVLQASWGNALATLGTGLMPVVEAILPMFQGLVNTVTDLAPAVGTNLVGGLNGATTAFQNVVGFVTQYQGLFIGLGAVLGAVTLATAAHAIVLRIQSGAMMASIMQMGIVRAGMAAWAAVQWVLNAAMSANPIGIVIIAITGLIAAVIWAYNNVGWFRDGVNNAWRVISGVTMGVLGAVGGFFRGLWSGAISFGRGVIAGFVGFVTGSWNNARAITFGVLGAVGGFFRSVWSGAISFGRGVIQGFIGFVIGGWSNISGNTRAIFSGISGFIGGIWGGIIGGAGRAVGGVISWFGGLPGRIRGAIGDAWGILSGIGARIIDGFLSGLQSSWRGVTDFVGGIADWIAKNKGPEEKDRHLLTPHGGWILGGLADSLEASLPLLRPPLDAAARMIGEAATATSAGSRTSAARDLVFPAPAQGTPRPPAQITIMNPDPETAAELTARKLVRTGQG
jgi:hypothetical protein